MSAPAAAPPHVVAGFTVPRVMFQVLAALVPVAAVHVYLYGPAILWLLAVGGVTALACEAVALRLRRRPARDSLRDGSVLVTAALLALAVPPTLPWWLLAFGIAVAVLIAKHAYGGLGQNLFNPAMVGYAVLLVSFPLEMTRWPAPGAEWDAVTGATALDALRTGLRQGYTMQEVLAGPAFGTVGAAGGQWLNLAALAGGLYLLARRIVRWHIPVATLAGLAVPARPSTSPPAPRCWARSSSRPIRSPRRPASAADWCSGSASGSRPGSSARGAGIRTASHSPCC